MSWTKDDSAGTVKLASLEYDAGRLVWPVVEDGDVERGEDSLRDWCVTLRHCPRTCCVPVRGRASEGCGSIRSAGS